MNETPDTAQRPAQPVVATGPLFGRSGRYWSPPFRLQEDMLIVDKKGAPILFVSGWAHLVGLGSHHLAVRDAHAAQVDLGAEIVGFLNRNWPNIPVSNERESVK